MNGSGRHAILSVALIAAFAIARPSLAEPAPVLQFDPFGLNSKSNSGLANTGRRGSDDVFTAILRSTVVSGDRSLVNLGGEILAIGEESHGYQLMEVRTFEATFVKDGKEVTLEIESEAKERR